MVLSRYRSRFGGEGTIVTLDDGQAFTAAHCVARVDGRPGTVLAAGGRQWRMVRRWSPRGRDIARLAVVDEGTGRAARRRPVPLAPPGVLRPGLEVRFHGFDGRRFVERRAVIVAVTATGAVADVRSRAGVADGDSGGPVLVAGRLAGLVVARLGTPRGLRASSHAAISQLDLHTFCTKPARPAF